MSNPLLALVGRELARRAVAGASDRSPAEMTDAEILRELVRLEAANGSPFTPDELREIAAFAEEELARRAGAGASNNFR